MCLIEGVEKWEDIKCRLYKFTLMSLVHKKLFIFYFIYFNYYNLQTNTTVEVEILQPITKCQILFSGSHWNYLETNGNIPSVSK